MYTKYERLCLLKSESWKMDYKKEVGELRDEG